jgi:diamine N-acetyltransferase
MASAPRLEPITPDNVRVACDIAVGPDQQELVAPVAWSLAEAYTMPDVAWPRLVVDGDVAVAFVMASFAPDHRDDLLRSYLWRLNVDAGHQGKGYGRFAVEAVCQEALARGQRRLTVSFHEGPHGPEGFYLGLGFRPTGTYNDDEKVAELLLDP